METLTKYDIYPSRSFLIRGESFELYYDSEVLDEYLKSELDPDDFIDYEDALEEFILSYCDFKDYDDYLEVLWDSKEDQYLLCDNAKLNNMTLKEFEEAVYERN